MTLIKCVELILLCHQDIKYNITLRGEIKIEFLPKIFYLNVKKRVIKMKSFKLYKLASIKFKL